MNVDEFTYCVRWSPAKQLYRATCDGFPLLDCLRTTPQEALLELRRMVKQEIALQNSDGHGEC